MNCSETDNRQQELLRIISDFANSARGIEVHVRSDEKSLVITQALDGKSLRLDVTQLEDVLTRADADGRSFIQINFSGGSKILLTETLIGFKPCQLAGVDMNRLPRVVTTPDVMSVFEAIQDALLNADEDTKSAAEVGSLKRVFESVVAGGEQIGFDLSSEKAWLARLPGKLRRISA